MYCKSVCKLSQFDEKCNLISDRILKSISPHNKKYAIVNETIYCVLSTPQNMKRIIKMYFWSVYGFAYLPFLYYQTCVVDCVFVRFRVKEVNLNLNFPLSFHLSKYNTCYLCSAWYLDKSFVIRFRGRQKGHPLGSIQQCLYNM